MKQNQEPDIDIYVENLKDELDKAYKIRIYNIYESINIVNNVLETSIANQLPKISATAHNLLGLFFMILGDYEKSRTFSYQALDFFNGINDFKGIANAKYNIASTYYKTDDYHMGLQWFLECLRLYRLLNDNHNEARVLKSVATIYEYFGDIDNAKINYEKSITIAIAANDPALESNSYNPLSGIYLKLGQVDEALAISEKSIAIKLAINDKRGLAFSIYSRGKVFLKQNKYKDALIDFIESLQIQREMGDRLGEGMVLNKLGLTYYHLHDFENAKKTLEDALNVGNKFNIKLIIYKAFYNLYELHKKINDWEKALTYLENYVSTKDSTVNTHTLNILKSYEAINKLDTIERESKSQRAYFEIVEKKNAELDMFFYRVSHDLKGPIASLLGLHNLIKYEGFEPRAEQYFDMYQSQLIRINTIILDLIDLTHMNDVSDKKVEIDFNEIIHNCVNSFIYHENFKQIKFVYEVEENLRFYSQWIIINTILQNLIENSIKYCQMNHCDSFVKIKIERENEQLKMTIEDNGQGIPIEFQNRIFDMFFRASEKSQGSGLGLYILKRAVERLNGKFKLISEVGVGSAFIIHLPY